METNKIDRALLIDMLRTFINSRPGMEFANYGNVAMYRSESRQITRDRDQALTLLNYVNWHDSITAEDIISASAGAFSGRLEIKTEGAKIRIHYCAGQYYPTEYRKAACSVLTSAIWAYLRTNCEATRSETWTDAIRKAARRELGASIANRWFR